MRVGRAPARNGPLSDSRNSHGDACCRRVSAWLFDQALPLWAQVGVDRQDGGFVEALTLSGQDAGVDFKRTRVTCRQIYVFSHAAVLGWKPGFELAEHGVEFLRRSWLGAGLGWPRSVTRAGEILDPTPDLYDIAFVLFALGWYVRATGDKSAAAWARQTLDLVETQMRWPSGPGFMHERPTMGWRVQNPHMHLLEAMLACFEATSEARYAEVAVELSDLFRERFFNRATKTLAEVFTEQWVPAAGDAGRVVEPGHQFEWAWILSRLTKLLGRETSELVRELIAFAEGFGVDRSSYVTYNQVRDDGFPLDRGSRIWPNAERIKAHIALYDMFGEDPIPAVAQSVNVLFDRFLRTDTPGLWIDHFNAKGEPISQQVPASTLYHVFLSFSETLRVDTNTPSAAGA